MKILHKHNRFTWERDLLCNTLNSAHHKHRYYVTLIIIRRKKKWNWSGQESLNQMRFVFLWLRYNGLQRTAASLIFRYWAPVEPFNSGTFFVAIKDLGANCRDNDASNDGYLIEPSHFFSNATRYTEQFCKTYFKSKACGHLSLSHYFESLSHSVVLWCIYNK